MSNESKSLLIDEFDHNIEEFGNIQDSIVIREQQIDSLRKAIISKGNWKKSPNLSEQKQSYRSHY